MKKLFILSAIAAGTLFYNNANAQISIHLGFNIPVRHVYVAPPPVVVQDEPVYDDQTDVSYNNDYYYLPEVEAYYSIPNHCYYYNDGRSWVSAAYLPGAYHNYNWRTAVRYEVRAPRPYLHHDVYRSRWGGYTGDRNNFARRFDNRYNGSGYVNRDNHFDNRGWAGDRNPDRNVWNNRPNQNQGRDDLGNWNNDRQNNRNDNRGNWNNGNQANNNGQGRGNWGNQPQTNPNNGGQTHGSFGGGRPDNNNQPQNNQGRGGNNSGERFAENNNNWNHRVNPNSGHSRF